MSNYGPNTKKYAEAMEWRDWQTCELICAEHEGLLQAIQAISKERDELKLENERMRGALEFYQRGYAHDVDDSHIAYFEYGHVRLSSGKRARQALSASGEKEKL
jgi:hypothetical protein